MSNKVTQKETQVRSKKYLGTWLLFGMAAFVCFFCINGMYVNASELNFGENIANWVLEQLFWIVLLAGIIAAALAGIKRAWVACITILVATGLLLVIIGNPTILQTIGNKLADIVGLV